LPKAPYLPNFSENANMSTGTAVESPAKPGWLSSEFWVTVSTAALTFIAFMVSIGIVSSADSENLGKAVSGAVGAIGSLLANAFTIWKYIQSRTAVKVAAVETAAVVMEAKAQIAEAETRRVELIASMPQERMHMVA
jgi:hypothetical protein